jgi:hypothetical protein
VQLSALQKRIIELSSKLVATDDPNQFKQLASELRMALHEHVSHLRISINDTKKHIVLAATGRFPGDENGNKVVPISTAGRRASSHTEPVAMPKSGTD